MSANPYTLLGIGNNGLGTIMQGINTQETQDLDQQKGLQALFNAQQQRQMNDIQMQKDALGLDTARQTQAGDIAAANVGNETKVGAAGLQKMQQFGERITQLGGAMKQMPVEQRQQYLQGLAQQIPGIAQDPTFQALMNADPNMLPQEIEKAGRNILLQTGEQMRASALRQQADDAAMAREQAGNAAALERTRITEGGANSRAGMAESRALELERLRQKGALDLADKNNEAGRYASKRAANDPATILSKLGYEKGAVYFQVQANNAKDPVEKAELQATADQFADMNIQSRMAGVTPGSTVGPNGDLIPNLPMGARSTSQAPQAPPAQAAPIQQAVSQAGWKYEPDQYNYRINPDTGRAQRQRK